MENKLLINKDELYEYTFYDDNNKLNVVLNEDFIKKLFNADILLWNEIE